MQPYSAQETSYNNIKNLTFLCLYKFSHADNEDIVTVYYLAV